MILDGEAGIGKSHLLADIINQRIEENTNSVFLLGQQFGSEVHPWSQILNDLLRLKCNEDEFLGALNSKAEVQNKRIIIFIDAINERKGRSFWNEFLIGFIESIKRYEWLGLVLSVRSSYMDLIVPREVIDNNLAIPLTHDGFDGMEYDASKLYFEYYNISQPSIPLLHPEFSNPLFLKLFCEGLQNKGLSIIPEGYEGISSIFQVFIEGIEDKLLGKYTNIKSLKLIDKVIKVLMSTMIDKQTIAYDEAYLLLLEDLILQQKIESGLLDDLIAEGLFTKNIFYKDGNTTEDIYFVYERFEDHLKVKYLFDNFLDKINPEESFEKEPLIKYFDGNNIYLYQGIIEAMSIQLPEICNVELIDVVAQNKIIIDGFFDSLLWRKAKSITPSATNYMLKNITKEDFQEKIFRVLYSTSSIPKHSLNANFLYDYLSTLTMKERDVFFIPLLNNIYFNSDANPIKRLIDWAWSNEDKEYISDDAILLTALALSWLLVTSNRQLRDYATKALISILEDRIFIVLRLLKKFENVNEPYIYERLFAVVFGVVVKIEDNNGLKEIGEYIYESIFNKDEIYPHILLRDYAKNTIDYINYLEINLEIDFEKVKPPYKSFFPKLEDLPINDAIDKYEDKGESYNQNRIISSMTTISGRGTASYGAFGRYIFGRALGDFECKKNEQLISNYATKKIFEEYGYDGEYFNESEKRISNSNQRNYDRDNHTIERIGKKYQWIAFYDTLARVTDNFTMYDTSVFNSDKKEVQYQGSFKPYIRDIDPTVLLKETELDRKSNEVFWWTPKHHIDWNMTNQEWIKHTDDLPNTKSLIEVVDKNDESWIMLSSFPDWDEPLKKGYDRYKIIHKSLRYEFKSYLVPKSEIMEFTIWAKKQNFWGNWMPDAKGHYEMFNREHYWSEAYRFFKNPCYESSEEWINIENNFQQEKYLNKIALTTDEYYWEEKRDYSKMNTLNFLKPSKILFDGLEMKDAKRDGEYIDIDNNLICFETSIYNKSHQCLLVKKEGLLKFLDDNNLTICWTVIGEKQVLAPNHEREAFLGLMEISSYTYLDNSKIINSNTRIMYMDSNHKKNFIDIELKG